MFTLQRGDLPQAYLSYMPKLHR